MIEYSRHILPNGLRVLLHRDEATPLVALNLLYQVGARDEQPERTGFAHLFEHLMFGGTSRYPDFDQVIDSLCGESNAFTNNDYTNYYLTIPVADGQVSAANSLGEAADSRLEQVLALEADRMQGRWEMNGDRWEVLEVQKKVVTEEYHQRYMNQPYGDAWMLLRPLCYHRHPYRWCTIGADIRHVQEASVEDVRQFFKRYYTPDNAILALAGNIDEEETLRLVERHFGSIPPSDNPLPPVPERRYAREYPQRKARQLEVHRDVPCDMFYLAWVMADRYSRDYYTYDALSDVLGNGHSSRLYRRMVQQEQLLSEVNAYITGDLDRGLFVVSGKLNPGVTFEQAEEAVHEEMALLASTPIPDRELEKVTNHFENTFVYSQYKAADRALSLCYFEMIGQTQLVNDEPEYYRQLTPHDLQRVAAQKLTRERCCTLRIRGKEEVRTKK